MQTIRTALELAKSELLLTSPNPRVGCIITTPDGQMLGQGSTQRVGGPHAETMALRDSAEKGRSVVGATAYVTLEPCSHHGRTGPCCDTLITAGIKKVVSTSTDPNPLVAGQGFARLRAAGVEVEVLSPHDPLAIQARELNIGFFSRMISKTLGTHDDGRHPWMDKQHCKTVSANGSPQRPHAPTATPGGPELVQCSPALAQCWPTTRSWTCVWWKHRVNPTW